MGVDAKEEGAKTNIPPGLATPPAEAVRISISDPKAEEEKVRQLYDALLRIRKPDSGDTPIPYPQFAKYIATQTRGIRERCQCSAVAFTIALEEDSIRFTAAADNR